MIIFTLFALLIVYEPFKALIYVIPFVLSHA